MPQPYAQKEIIFLADRSGSMADKIFALRRSLAVFLQSLPKEGVQFNIASFGSTCTLLWPESRQYNQATLAEAQNHLRTDFTANMGGTEILEALKSVIGGCLAATVQSTEVLVLTDGEVWGTEAVTNYIRDMKRILGDKIRFFALGIGEAVSHKLVEGIGRYGGGFAEVVASQSTGAWEGCVIKMLKSALSASSWDCHISLARDQDTFIDSTQRVNVIGDDSCIKAPHALPPLHSFTRFTSYFLIENSNFRANTVAIKGRSSYGTEITVHIPIVRVEVSDAAILSLAAKAILMDMEQGHSQFHAKLTISDQKSSAAIDLVRLEGERIGKQWSVTSKWTSFVGTSAAGNLKYPGRILLKDSVELAHLTESRGGYQIGASAINSRGEHALDNVIYCGNSRPRGENEPFRVRNTSSGRATQFSGRLPVCRDRVRLQDKSELLQGAQNPTRFEISSAIGNNSVVYSSGHSISSGGDVTLPIPEGYGISVQWPEPSNTEARPKKRLRRKEPVAIPICPKPDTKINVGAGIETGSIEITSNDALGSQMVQDLNMLNPAEEMRAEVEPYFQLFPADCKATMNHDIGADSNPWPESAYGYRPSIIKHDTTCFTYPNPLTGFNYNDIGNDNDTASTSANVMAHPTHANQMYQTQANERMLNYCNESYYHTISLTSSVTSNLTINTPPATLALPTPLQSWQNYVQPLPNLHSIIDCFDYTGNFLPSHSTDTIFAHLLTTFNPSVESHIKYTLQGYGLVNKEIINAIFKSIICFVYIKKAHAYCPEIWELFVEKIGTSLREMIKDFFILMQREGMVISNWTGSEIENRIADISERYEWDE